MRKINSFLMLLIISLLLLSCPDVSETPVSDSNTPSNTPSNTLYNKGTLDLGFNDEGFNSDYSGTATGTYYVSGGEAIAVDDSGNTYITGKEPNGTNYDMALWKYTPEGVLDTSFNGTGMVKHDGAAIIQYPADYGDDSGTGIVLDSNNNIFISGYSWNGSNFDVIIWKYTSAGILDTTFRSVGYVIHDSVAGGSGDDYALDIIINESDDMFITGQSTGSNLLYNMFLCKYNAAGLRYSNFGTSGVVTVGNYNLGDGMNTLDYAPVMGYNLTLDANENIFVCGAYGLLAIGDDHNYVATVWKFDASGNLANSFGGSNSGTASFQMENMTVSRDIAIDSDGYIYITGHTGIKAPPSDFYTDYRTNRMADYPKFTKRNRMFICKFETSGVIDSSFGNNGSILFGQNSLDQNQNLGKSIIIDNYDCIYVAGTLCNYDDDFKAAVWKFDKDGNAESHFSGNGYADFFDLACCDKINAINRYECWGEAMTMDSSGNIYVTGNGYKETAVFYGLTMFVCKLN